MTKNKKTEHAGAKNGGGHWGTRHEAKTISKIARRQASKAVLKKEINELEKALKPKSR